MSHRSKCFETPLLNSTSGIWSFWTQLGSYVCMLQSDLLIGFTDVNIFYFILKHLCRKVSQSWVAVDKIFMW